MPVRCSVTIAAPVERVFAALTEIDRFSGWNPSVLVEHLDGQPLAVGTRHRHTSGSRVLETRIAHVEVPNRFVVDFDDRRTRGRFEYRLTPAGTGTSLSYERRYERAPLGVRVLSIVCPWWLGRGMRRSLQRLKSYLEASTQPAR